MSWRTGIFSGVVPRTALSLRRVPKPPTLRLTALALGAVLASSSIASLAHAQTYTAAEAMERAAALVAELEAAGSCDVSLHGAPQLDQMTDRWLIAYSAAGAACDDAGAALQREGLELDITFFRRPNADEIKGLIARMRASVRKGFACLISFRGEPRFDEESNLWMVLYYTSGQQCQDAGDELERQGRELRVLFHRLR